MAKSPPLGKMPEPEKRKTLLGYLQGWFLAGLLATAPVVLTVFIIRFVIDLIDGRVLPLLPDNLLPDFRIPGLGLIIAIVVIIAVGALTAGFIGAKLVQLGERIVHRLPIAGSIYGAIKQIVETVLASKSDSFREVVLVEYPRRGIWVIGFVSGSTRGEVAGVLDDAVINVFVPTTPNPTSGFLLFVKRKEAISLAMSVEEAVKMVVSGGIVTPPDPNPGKRKPKQVQAKKKQAKKAQAKRKTKTKRR